MAVKKTELYSLLWEACDKLRGGVEPARYKDYVLVLLFFKYVSDRYKGTRYGEFTVSPGASFDDLISAKGKKDVGERVDTILSKFLEDNQLQGSLPEVSFNDEAELGKGKELVDKVSGLIGVFQNPAIDFKNNRASGDDIIGDAYEFFMMKFAQESGKSKGQFYTPSEVSRTIARLLGISHIKQSVDKKWTLYDPAAGSGSLLIRAADEAPKDANGDSIVTIYGQEKDHATAGLAKMNLILHQKGTGEIKTDSTLYEPQFLDEFGQLRQFDFVVMNPPFSDKSWSDGINPEHDKYGRFKGYGIPPEKNGDYAWFLHVLKSLTDDGKAAIIMPHGILFRGNSEEGIRKEILKRKYITGIVSLPANLFYGTGIPACIIVIDKENAEEHEGIFMIDASHGFKKDGAKNRLREQDIEKIVQAFTKRQEIEGYSRMVSYEEINEKNDGNLNVPRYIQPIDDTLPQNIAAHLQGGIPREDLNSLHALWDIAPHLKAELFKAGAHDRFDLLKEQDEIASVIAEDKALDAQKQVETCDLFDAWKEVAKDKLMNIQSDIDPRLFIRRLSQKLLYDYQDAKLLDAYDVFDVLMNYWNEKLQDDVYIIKASGYLAGCEIEYKYGTKKEKQDGETVTVEDKSKVNGFDGVLIPIGLLEDEFFSEDKKEIEALNERASALEAQMSETVEDQDEEENLFKEVLSNTGKVTDKLLNDRIKVLEGKKQSKELYDLDSVLVALAKKDTEKAKTIIDSNEALAVLDLCTKTGKPNKAKVTAARKELADSLPVPDSVKDEYEALSDYAEKNSELKALKKEATALQKALDEKLLERYPVLTEEEIKHLLFDRKWMLRLKTSITAEFGQVINQYAQKITEIAKRYKKTLPEIETEVQTSRDAVMRNLERMGYTW